MSNALIATPQMSLRAAAEAARSHGVTPVLLGDAIEGEAREVGKVFAGVARSAALHGEPARAPCVLLSGGETTVTVRGKGRGGRNAEFLLGLAIALDGAPRIHALAGDTDGIDGSEDNAGAYVAPDTLARAAALGLEPKERLADNDAYSLFAALGDLVVTGPTLTNVNDFRAILIERSGGAVDDDEAQVVALEQAALRRWCAGDPSGFLEICDNDVVYFDPFLERRLDGLVALTSYYESLRGKVSAARFEMQNPRVQRTGDAATMAELRTIASGTSLPVMVGSGVDPDNVGDIFTVADGVIVASWLKRDGVWWNPVDPERLAVFMQAVARARG